MEAPLTAPLERILPHRPPMVLLDQITTAEPDALEAEWSVPASSPWVEAGRLRRSALVELAAQTAVARVGLTRYEQSLHPLPGYLGAVDGFTMEADVPAGARLHCRAEFRFWLGRLVRAACVVRRGGPRGDVVARGELTLVSGQVEESGA